MDKNDKLTMWQELFEKARMEYQEQVDKMEVLWRQYLGDAKLKSDSETNEAMLDRLKRNITYEMIEAQVDSSIPQPKVSSPDPSPRKQKLAKIIEAMLLDFLKRNPFERINDEEERLCPVMGGAFRLTNWNSELFNNKGRCEVRSLAPTQVLPQPGCTDLRFMDYVFISFTETKKRLSRFYDVEIADGETSDDIADVNEKAVIENPEELITQTRVYYRCDGGGIGVFSWAGNTVLEDMENFQARSKYVCCKCGRAKPGDGSPCECGSKGFESRPLDFEELYDDIMQFDGTVIPGYIDETDEDGNVVLTETESGENGFSVLKKEPRRVPNKIPYFVPTVFPLMLRKNISVFGKFLGDSDCEKIRDLQLAHDGLARRIQTKITKGGSVLTLPKNKKIETSDREDKIVYLDTPAEKNMIDAITLQPNISQDMAMLNVYYENIRSTLGITDSFQGKRDSTAVSGAAKQAQIEQASGRLRSKKEMKNAAYEELFEAVFQYMLAYYDGPLDIPVKNETGQPDVLTFNRYDFLVQDAAGKWVYDADFIFETDSNGTFMQNRSNLWQEIRQNFASGCYGNPQNPQTLLLFWEQMEAADYPSALSAKAAIEEQIKQAQAAQAAIPAMPAGTDIPGAQQ